MDGRSDLEDEEFRTAPSTREHSLSINRPPAITQLSGVFVPSCNNGTVIYPTTTQANPDLRRRPSIVPPGPPTTLDCSLLSNGDLETITWSPQASSVFRRPSRCMSMDQTRAQAHSHCLPAADSGAATKGSLSGILGQGKHSSDTICKLVLIPIIIGNKCLAGKPQNPPLRSGNDSHNQAGADGTRHPHHSIKTTPVRGRCDLSGSHTSFCVRHSWHSSQSENLSETPKRSGYSLWGKPNVLMQAIMGKVRNRLAGHRRVGSISPNSPGVPELCSQGSCQYLINDDQVQDVVEIVFQEMCKHNTAMDAFKTTIPQQADDSSMQTRLIRKPSCLKTAIELQPARAADPATTISEPETSFFTRSATDGQVRSKGIARPVPITTIISRDSITDIRWLSDIHASQVDQESISDASEAPASAVSQGNSSSMFNVSSIIEGIGRTVASEVALEPLDFQGFCLGSESVSKVHRRKENVEESSVDGDDGTSSITSFPSLPQRHCTNEWLRSPADLAASEDKGKIEMYHLGIDARLGSIAPVTEQLPHMDSDNSLIHGIISSSHDSASKIKPSRRASEALADSRAREEIMIPGALPETVRRRSAHFADPLVQETHKREPGFMPQITRKISSAFKSPASSGRTTRAPAPSEVNDEVSRKAGGELGASRPAAGNGDPAVGCLSEPEPNAVYQAMVLSKPTKDKKKRRSTCSEDYVPHMCEDDLSMSGLPSPNGQ
ncbi:hypothetical protein CORC01_13416 [Colletotrichum orchidophilum]|uniref:Uncharacterized protein n=1 Tax=Colletotrichum orchidophilum TaxID=1209926 RepID=A0A1G4AQC4_9PEZI|nr:uncharacterized protein CORC01_13416 [Colletotrichum orchidophilum]OHE91301.1 hypothetical protein CORC01_13416 [Colletotrichum orchidophilum]